MLTRIHRRSDWIGDVTKVGDVKLTRLTSLGDCSLGCTSCSRAGMCTTLHCTILYCIAVCVWVECRGGREYVDSRDVGNRND